MARGQPGAGGGGAAGSEARYRRIFEQAHDIILTADLDQVITDLNPAAAAAMEAPREEIVGRPISDFVTPEGFEQTTRMLRHKVEQGGTTHHNLEVIARSGRVMEWEINSTLTLDPAGRPVGLHAIARDVTDRRRAEERQRLLVNELNHRVKNTLALVQGLALQSFSDGRDPARRATPSSAGWRRWRRRTTCSPARAGRERRSPG